MGGDFPCRCGQVSPETLLHIPEHRKGSIPDEPKTNIKSFGLSKCLLASQKENKDGETVGPSLSSSLSLPIPLFQFTQGEVGKVNEIISQTIALRSRS